MQLSSNLFYLIVDHFVINLDEISGSFTDHVDRGNGITGNYLRNRKRLIHYKTDRNILIEIFFWNMSHIEKFRKNYFSTILDWFLN